MLTCTFGMAPSSLVVVRPNATVEGRPVATIADMAPGVNVMPFGMCQSLANPQVAAATAAALGVLTPMPCTPIPNGMWSSVAPGTRVGGVPVLAQGAVLKCAYLGVISVSTPGSTTTEVQ
jgi:hypothetical protein